jgi:hypothetical protein
VIEELLPHVVPGLVLCAIFVWLIHELRKRPSLLRPLELEMRESGWHGRRLGRASLFRLRVYSAETLDGKEVGIIHDRLPRKFPLLRVVGIVGVLLAVWYALR